MYKKLVDIFESIKNETIEKTWDAIFAKDGKYYAQLFLDDGLYKKY